MYAFFSTETMALAIREWLSVGCISSSVQQAGSVHIQFHVIIWLMMTAAHTVVMPDKILSKDTVASSSMLAVLSQLTTRCFDQGNDVGTQGSHPIANI